MQNNNSNPATLRAEASQHEQDAADSFERCDTDGFMSQWASGCNAAKKRLQADIEDNDGLADVPALFDLDGGLIPAKLIDTRFGTSWGIFKSWDALNGSGDIVRWVGAFPARRSTLANKDVMEGRVMARAYADLRGKSACNVTAVIVRTQFDGNEEIVTADRFAS
tara:strand:- start:7593 stop:8087 length:495 start_codon:yes stop_codon:yes gene_type:complete